MNKIKCNKCGNEYDDFFLECPYCKNEKYNEKFVNLSEINNDKKESTNSSIIFNEEDLSIKEDIINRRNESLKRKKNSFSKSKKQYSYLLLIMGMILLFIIIFSTLQEFSLVPFIHYIVTVIMLFIAFSISYQEIEFGYILGIISSLSMISMIYEGDYISAIIGIYIFISSFRFLIKK